MPTETTRPPDILEVLSDLSNDEVFTPPNVANAVLDLLPEEVWSIRISVGSIPVPRPACFFARSPDA